MNLHLLSSRRDLSQAVEHAVFQVPLDLLLGQALHAGHPMPGFLPLVGMTEGVFLAYTIVTLAE